MFKNLNELQKMLQSAREIQEKIEKELTEMRIEGSSGGGMVKVVLDGRKNLISLHLEPEIVNPADCEMLEDLILAAFNEASSRVDEQIAAKLGAFSTSFKIPGLF
ncbi:MAG: YbaB/EbfC family nucleoid-associated protein [Candidatus Aminicenantes bacterium]|nr:YbaB/EbfC family nucleoid-associated protein [Candidatus Aminicenantes bacterium]